MTVVIHRTVQEQYTAYTKPRPKEVLLTSPAMMLKATVQSYQLALEHQTLIHILPTGKASPMTFSFT